MVNRRKLEEEIARTKDPVIRKQLQELLDKREQGRNRKIMKIKQGWKTICQVLGPSPSRELTPEEIKENSRQATLVMLISIGMVVVVPLLLILLIWLFGGFN